MSITQNLWGRTRFGASDNDIPEDFIEVESPSTFQFTHRVGFYPHQKESGEYVFPYRTTKSVLEDRLAHILRGYVVLAVGGTMADDLMAIDQFCRHNGIIADIEQIGSSMWAGFCFKPVAIRNPLQARINRIKAIGGDWSEFNKKFGLTQWFTAEEIRAYKKWEDSVQSELVKEPEWPSVGA